MTHADRPFRSRLSPTAATAWLIAVTTLLHAWLAASVGLGVGEAYYFGAIRHLSLSYFDQPPAGSWLGWLGVQLAGTVNDFVLRAPFVVLFAFTTWLTFLLGRRLFGPWAGFWAALLINVCPLFSISTAIFYQPEGPLMFGWAATLCFLAPLMVEEAPTPHATRTWVMAGLMLGLTLLGKYTAVLLPFGTLVYLLLTRDPHRWLRRKEPYLAALAALVCFTPVLLWNAQHHWISLLWQGSRGVAFHGLRLDWLAKNIGGQMLEIQPWIWIPLMIEPFRAFWKSTPPAQRQARVFLACVGAPPVLAFTAVAAYGNIGNHFHWAAPGYFTLLIAMGASIDSWVRRRPLPALAAVGAMVAATVAFTGLLFFQAITGRFSEGNGALARWFQHGNDPTVELMDFHELAPAFSARGLLGRRDLFVFSDRWYLGGKVDYALRGTMPFMLLNPDDPREYAFWEHPGRWVGKEGILVSERDSLAAIARDYGPYCSSLDTLGTVPIVRRARVERTLHLYRCASLTRAYPLPYH